MRAGSRLLIDTTEQRRRLPPKLEAHTAIQRTTRRWTLKIFRAGRPETASSDSEIEAFGIPAAHLFRDDAEVVSSLHKVQSQYLTHHNQP
jgi:hypothetical protein